jgi:hypothetical protein
MSLSFVNKWENRKGILWRSKVMAKKRNDSRNFSAVIKDNLHCWHSAKLPIFMKNKGHAIADKLEILIL